MRRDDDKKYPGIRKFFSKIAGFFTNPSVIAAFIIFVILTIIMLVIFVSERKTNSHINTLFDAIWYTIVTITTVGYGDITPESVFGRISAITLLVVGVAIFGALSGKFASFLLDRQQKKDRGLLKMTKMKNHFLICGWKPNFEKILEGVLAANPEISAENIVLLNNAALSEIEVIQSKEKFKSINYLRGDFTDEQTLIKAQIKTAERVLILADASENYSTLEIDSRTVLAVITIKNLNPKIYCVAEINDSKFEKHLSLAHCDEIILTKDYEQNLLVQASSGKGMSHILRELISEDTESGIVLASIPDKFVGVTYGEYRRSLKTKDILVGILENTGNFYIRRQEALAEAQKNPDMEKIVSNLRKVKTLKSNIPVFNPDDEYIIPDSSKAIFIHGSVVKEA
ncbi:ion channel [Treponema sp.]|uniref:ion channel n=1 Tax=Treponema sp. TaxID=166 RepID=UPI00298E64D4|nr:ion channel [Treponema sp.]